MAYPWEANDLLFSFAAEHEKNVLLGIADSPQTGYVDIYTGKSLKFENWEPRGGVLRLGSFWCPGVYGFYLSESARRADSKYLLGLSE